MRIFVPSSATLLTDRAGHGEGLIAWGILSGLAARGHELVVCAREADLSTDPPFELIVTGRASRFESVEPLAYARRARRLLVRLGGVRRFDVAHWLYPAEPHEALFLPSGLPLVVGPLFAPWPPRPRDRRFRAGDAVRAVASPLLTARHRRVLSGAAAVLLATPEASRRDAAGRERLLPPGVDAARFTPTAPAGGRILFVGKLERAKGVRELVEAFAQTRTALPEAELVLAGDGPDRAWLETERDRLGLDGSLKLLGAIEHERVPSLMAEATLVCLPSPYEPYGMAVVEAMAAGRPVVAVDTGGPHFLVDPVQGGRLVPPGDAGALAAALVELLSDSERLRAAGSFNRARVERDLSLAVMLDALEAVYAELVR